MIRVVQSRIREQNGAGKHSASKNVSRAKRACICLLRRKSATKSEDLTTSLEVTWLRAEPAATTDMLMTSPPMHPTVGTNAPFSQRSSVVPRLPMPRCWNRATSGEDHSQHNQAG
jgi:hypothetical protein